MIGRIYKIIVNCSNEIYIGSTFQECRARWQGHKSDWNYRYNRKKAPSSFELFEKWGIENCKIILIKEYEVIDRCHLEAYEQLWVNRLNPINKHNPFYISHIHLKNKYILNRERILEYQKKRLQNDPELNKKKYQKYISENPYYNKEKYRRELELNPNLNEQKRKKYQEDRLIILEKLKEKILCETCQIEINKSSISRHKRTKKHILLTHK